MYRSRNDRGVNKKNTFWNELERMKDKILNRYCVMVIVSKILKLGEGGGTEAFGVDEKNKIGKRIRKFCAERSCGNKNGFQYN